MYLDEWPVYTSVFVACMFGSYHMTDLVDGKHAKETSNTSALGFIVNMSCDFVGAPFLTIAYLMVMGLRDAKVLWYSVQVVQMVFLWAQLTGYLKGGITFGLFTGPGEAVFVCSSMLLTRAVTLYLGLNIDVVWPYLARFSEMATEKIPFPIDPQVKAIMREARAQGATAYDIVFSDPELIAYYVTAFFYFCMVTLVFVRVLLVEERCFSSTEKSPASAILEQNLLIDVDFGA